jgi:hypothetical protein
MLHGLGVLLRSGLLIQNKSLCEVSEYLTKGMLTAYEKITKQYYNCHLPNSRDID